MQLEVVEGDITQLDVDAVANAIAPILDAVTATECANYFVNAGYEGPKIIPL